MNGGGLPDLCDMQAQALESRRFVCVYVHMYVCHFLVPVCTMVPNLDSAFSKHLLQ